MKAAPEILIQGKSLAAVLEAVTRAALSTAPPPPPAWDDTCTERPGAPS